MNIIEFIPENFMIAIPALYILGIFIKNTNYMKDELIPPILTLIGVFFCIGLSRSISIESIIQGILCSGAAVLGDQTIKQLSKLKE